MTGGRHSWSALGPGPRGLPDVKQSFVPSHLIRRVAAGAPGSGPTERKRSMSRGVVLILIGAWLAAAPTGPFVLGDDAPPAVKPFGLAKRVPWTTSRLVGSPDPPAPYRLERVFPKVKFKG